MNMSGNKIVLLRQNKIIFTAERKEKRKKENCLENYFNFSF
jgi:hypothetical protein